jgi:hypothetical protein
MGNRAVIAYREEGSTKRTTQQQFTFIGMVVEIVLRVF